MFLLRRTSCAFAEVQTYIILGQEVKGAKHFVVVKLEALGGLEALQVVAVHRRGFGHLLGTPLGLVLPVRILRGDSRPSSGAAMVAVRVRRVRWHGGSVVLRAVVVA